MYPFPNSGNCPILIPSVCFLPKQESKQRGLRGQGSASRRNGTASTAPTFSGESKPERLLAIADFVGRQVLGNQPLQLSAVVRPAG